MMTFASLFSLATVVVTGFFAIVLGFFFFVVMPLRSLTRYGHRGGHPLPA